ncbi:MAG: SRPBCC domain-containing protein [Alphaproteobacteria bacterium]|nr:SRPBCC domain-containing protein [Alphaproteobacteria bacterium]
MTDDRVELTRTFASPPMLVWRCFTEAELLGKWFAPGSLRPEVLAFEPRLGGAWRVRMTGQDRGDHVAFGTFEALEPTERLVFTWAWESGSVRSSRVTVTLHDEDGATHLTLVHAGLPSPSAVADHAEGWEGCLDKLEPLLQKLTFAR